MTMIIKNETEPGEVFAGTISQIELGMLRAAYLGPDDVLVVQMPVDLSDEGWDRIRTELKLKIPDRRVVLVGPGVVFGILNIEPDRTLSPTADLKDKLGEAERILRGTMFELQETIIWAEKEIQRLGLERLARALGQIRIEIDPVPAEGGDHA